MKHEIMQTRKGPVRNGTELWSGGTKDPWWTFWDHCGTLGPLMQNANVALNRRYQWYFWYHQHKNDGNGILTLNSCMTNVTQ
jgi:hypothetical protein